MNRKKEYKSMEKWRKACNRQRLRYYRKTSFAKNHNKSWTEEEIEIVMNHEVPDHTISEIIGRSVAAIQMVRCKQNKKRGAFNG